MFRSIDHPVDQSAMTPEHSHDEGGEEREVPRETAARLSERKERRKQTTQGEQSEDETSMPDRVECLRKVERRGQF